MLNIFEFFIFLTVIYIFVELVMCNSFFNMTTAIKRLNNTDNKVCALCAHGATNVYLNFSNSPDDFIDSVRCYILIFHIFLAYLTSCYCRYVI